MFVAIEEHYKYVEMGLMMFTVNLWQLLKNQERIWIENVVLANKDRLNILRSPSLLGTIAQTVYLLKIKAFRVVHILSVGPVDKTKSHALDILYVQ